MAEAARHRHPQQQQHSSFNGAAEGAASFDKFTKQLAFAEGEWQDDAAVAEAEELHRLELEKQAEKRAAILHVDGCQLLLYTLLVLLLTASISMSRHAEFDYYFAEMVRENVLESEMDTLDTEVASVFDDITSLEGIYQFLRGPFLAALYVEASASGQPLPPSAMRRVNDQNILVGSISLQQVRVAPGDHCDELFAAPDAAPAGEGQRGACYPSFSRATHDTSTIVGVSKASSNPAACGAGGPSVGSPLCAPNEYQWQDRAANGIGQVEGGHSVYDGSGYSVVLPLDYASARTTILTLEADNFLGPRTRALWVDFALYNANVNRFCLARLMFERLESGVVSPRATVRAHKLIWYDGVNFPWQLAAEGALIFLVLVFIGIEIRSMRRVGVRAYWLDPSNWYDWPSLLMFGLVSFMRYKTWTAMLGIKASIREDASSGVLDTTSNFQAAAWWAGYEQMLLSISVLLVYLKVLHFLAGVPHISNLMNTLVRAKVQLAAFIVCLAVLMFAFASAFNLALGNDLEGFRNLGHASLSLLEFVLGEVDVQSMMRHNGVLGTLLYVAFFFLVYLVAVNIFLAIVTDSYAVEKATAHRVNLPKVLAAAARRQLARTKAVGDNVVHALGAPFRTVRSGCRHLLKSGRWRRRRAKADGGGDDGGDEAILAGCAAASAAVAASADAQAPAVEESAHATAIDAMSEEDRSAAALRHMAEARDAMEGGHLFVLNEVSVALKSLCFRQDSSDITLRKPLATALAELERLSILNDALKAKALDEGWAWDLASAQLFPSGNGKRGATGSMPARADSAAAQVDCEMDPALKNEAALERRDEESVEAMEFARMLARGDSHIGVPGAAGNSQRSTGACTATTHTDRDDANGASSRVSSFAAFARAMALDEVAAEPTGGGGAGGGMGGGVPHHRRTRRHRGPHIAF
jgi:hypothetical protein